MHQCIPGTLSAPGTRLGLVLQLGLGLGLGTGNGLHSIFPLYLIKWQNSFVFHCWPEAWSDIHWYRGVNCRNVMCDVFIPWVVINWLSIVAGLDHWNRLWNGLLGWLKIIFMTDNKTCLPIHTLSKLSDMASLLRMGSCFTPLGHYTFPVIKISLWSVM